jgi:hypothetical protein
MMPETTTMTPRTHFNILGKLTNEARSLFKESSLLLILESDSELVLLI